MESVIRLPTVAALGTVLLASAVYFAAFHHSRPRAASVLLFAGTGASHSDVAAIEDILTGAGLDYATADSSELNEMNEAQLRAYRLLIVPGGNFVEMGHGLSSSTATNVRTAVKDGLNYFGICAGAFLAGHFPAPYGSFNLTSGVKFFFYPTGTRKTAVRITTAGGPALDQYWEDGPRLSGWGAVVAKYPNGTPAVAEGRLGRGHVLISGVHPEAPEEWRRGLVFATPVSQDQAYAAQLIKAALQGRDLPHY